MAFQYWRELLSLQFFMLYIQRWIKRKQAIYDQLALRKALLKNKHSALRRMRVRHRRIQQQIWQARRHKMLGLLLPVMTSMGKMLVPRSVWVKTRRTDVFLDADLWTPAD